MIITEISVFKPNSRQKQMTITAPIARQATDALGERLGADAQKKAVAALNQMGKLDVDLLQIRHADRRIRIKTTEQ